MTGTGMTAHNLMDLQKKEVDLEEDPVVERGLDPLKASFPTQFTSVFYFYQGFGLEFDCPTLKHAT
jgi:hypothetical protein